MSTIRVVFACASMALSTFALTQAQESNLSEAVVKNRYQLTLGNGTLSGNGVAVLKQALDGAQFVLVGEDHGISQIPAFYQGLCQILGPAGFHTMAIETGPLAAAELERWVIQPDGRQKLISFEKQYPETIAFYNWAEEYDLLSRCAALGSGGQFKLWGLDQELMGSPRLLLSKILDQNLGPGATVEARRLLQKNDAAHDAAVKSGSPGDMFMFSVTNDELTHFRDLLRREGNPASQSLIDELIESREIYQKNMDGRGAESNRQRALLMKRNFFTDYRAAEQPGGNPPKVMFKFGAWHMFKGINPLHNNDLGNFVTELADRQPSNSVHIMIVAVKGSQLRFAGIGRPFQPTPFNLAEDKDSDFLYLQPMFTAVQNGGLTMFDLRGLRKNFRKLGPVETEMDRLIFGYDFLVLVPEATPSKQLD